MIGFTLISTSSLAVATFAWLTSNSKATLSTTELRVESGLTFTFYAYKDNFADPANDNYTVTGYQSSSLDNGFANDFVEITDASWTSFPNMYPGDKLTFAIKVEGIASTSIGLDVSLFTSTHSTNLLADINGVNIPIDFAWATDVYGDSSPTSDYYTKFVAGNQYEDQDDQPVPLEDKLEQGGFDFGEVVSETDADRHFNILETDRISSRTTYLFYTICFSNAPSTYFSLKSGSQDVFIPDDEHGNSNCYKGLGFQINELSIREGGAS